jgi:hypothetical protein
MCQAKNVTPNCGADDFCGYTASVGSTCIWPDVDFCDYTDGGRPDCTRSDGTYPVTPALCGLKECSNAAVCSWGPCTPMDAGH